MQLINRLRPTQFERLSNYMARLGKANYYEAAQWYDELLPPPRIHRFDLLPYAQLTPLAQITGLDINQICQMTLHRFVPMYGREWLTVRKYKSEASQPSAMELPWWPNERVITKFVHPKKYWKFCPTCWREHQSFLLPWMLYEVTACPIHHLLLIDRCSECHKLLSSDAAKSGCVHCGCALVDMEGIPIHDDVDSLEMTTILWTALGLNEDANTQNSLPLSPNHPLSQQSPLALFQFFRLVGRLVYDRVAESTIFTHNFVPPPVVKVSLYETEYRVFDYHLQHVGMWRIIKEWPHAWHSVLQEVVQEQQKWHKSMRKFPTQLERAAVQAGLPWVMGEWNVFMESLIYSEPKTYRWLHYYNTHQNGQLASQSPLLSQRKAERELGVGNKTLKRFIENRSVQATAPQETPGQRSWRLLNAESVQQLRQVREQYLTLSQAATFLGISEEQVVALVAADLIAAVEGPYANGAPIWRFSQSSVDLSIKVLLMAVGTRQPEQGCQIYTFKEIQRSLTGVGITLPRLLLLIRSSSLQVYRIDDTQSLQNLWCKASDLAQFVLSVRFPDGRKLLSVGQVCDRIECKSGTLRRLYASELLVPVEEQLLKTGMCWRYDPADVDAFIERYVTTYQAAKILRIEPLTVQNWTRSGRLKAVSGPHVDGGHVYRFNKDWLIQWRHERLKFGETMKLLDVSRATLHRWTEEGRLKALQDMGGQQRWFARTEVEKLKSSMTQPASVEQTNSTARPKPSEKKKQSWFALEVLTTSRNRIRALWTSLWSRDNS